MSCNFYVILNSISVLSGQLEGDNERLFAKVTLFTVKKISAISNPGQLDQQASLTH